MLRIRPFAALRPQPNTAPQIAAPPYDVVSTAEARQIAEGNPHCFLRVSRAELEFPDGTDPASDAVYTRARENLDRLVAGGLLVREPKPRLYLYRLVMNHHSQLGVVCCCHVDDYLNSVIKKHETTRKDKEDDRTRHTLAINANAGPVFLTYRDQPGMKPLVAADTNERPLIHFNAPDGVTHTVWTVRDPKPYVDLFSRVECAYVADGHHRAASAARAATQRRAANPGHTQNEEYNWFLAAVFPASQLTILPYNRVVADLRGQTMAQLLDRLCAVGAITTAPEPSPPRPGVFCFYVQRTWRSLTLDPASIDRSDPIGSLDVALLQDRVLGPILGIGDPRTDKRIDFVGGIRGTAELERRVNSAPALAPAPGARAGAGAGAGAAHGAGHAAIAFSLFPTTMEQLMAVADAGSIMPPKSTWFEPKLRSGLLIHTLD